MIKSAIFDLDGTLADTLFTISHFANNALFQNGFPPIEKEKYRYMVGDGAKNLVLRMLKEINATEQAFEQVYHLYNKSYDDNFLYKTEPYDGIIDMLKALHAMGIKLGVVSNKPHSTTEKIAQALFSPYISLSVGQRGGVPKKPDPTAVFELLESFDTKPENCIYIGDTATDMKTGKNAGIFTIGVLWGFRDYDELYENNADLIVMAPDEITEYVKTTNAK